MRTQSDTGFITLRQSFDKDVPEWQQRLRVMQAKTPGWKHGTKRRSWKVKEAAKKRAEHLKQQFKRYKEKVRAYWTGKTDKHP